MVKVYSSSVIDAPDPLEQGGTPPCKSPKSEGV
jgi:hypothetical protein